MKTILILFSVCIYCSTLNAQPGTLDKSFGENGKVYTAYTQQQFNVASSAIQPDDKIVVAGNFYTNNKSGFFINRYLPKGNLDTSFGDSGKVMIDFNYSVKARDLVIQPNGKIIVTGYGVRNGSGTYDMLTVRVTTNGKRDSSFGHNGKVITDFGTNEFSNGVCVQQDGKIVLAGVYDDTKCLLVRYNSNGKLDSTFGYKGAVISAITFITGYRSVVVQTNKKIIAGGSAGSSNSIFLLCRYKPNGDVDSSFGSAGFVETKCSNNGDNLEKLLLQNDGKVLAVGRTGLNGLSDTLKDMVAVRYTNKGVLDNSFGKSGIATISLKNSYLEAYSAVLQTDGKLILAGDKGTTNNPANYCIARLTKSGLPDSSFGNNGLAFTHIKLSNIVYGVGVQKNGDIIAAGNSNTKDIFTDGISLAAYYQNENIGKVSGNSIALVTDNNISLYPNPVKSILYVTGLSSKQKTLITVIDLNGKIKLQAVANDYLYSLNLSSIQPGEYLLKIEVNDNVITKKFIKQ